MIVEGKTVPKANELAAETQVALSSSILASLIPWLAGLTVLFGLALTVWSGNLDRLREMDAKARLATRRYRQALS